MLSLAPLSGLQAVIKRRNSKLARRDSLSIEHSNLALPGPIRRFSSSENLNSQSPAPTPNIATVSRKSSFSRRIRKISSGSIQPQTDVVETCYVLDLHIAKIKRKLAEFRAEDVDFSERVEELTSTVDCLCQDYRIPVDTDSLPRLSTYLHMLQNTEPASSRLETDQDEEEEEDFHKFCQTHTYLMGTNSHHAGYRTLPLPPDRGERRTNTPKPTHPKRSHSYEGHRLRDPGLYATLSVPRRSCPENHMSKKLRFEVPYQGKYHPRPLSYQEISYDENDYEETCPNESWGELSCP